MFCPECGKSIEDNSKVCPECGKEIAVKPQEVAKNHPNAKAPKKAKKPSKFSEKMKKLRTKKAFWIVSISFVIILIALIVILILKEPHPITTAEKLSEKLGEQIVYLEKNADVHVGATSKSAFVNSNSEFDYIYESKKMIKADGVNVPEWAIYLYEDDKKITRICYQDYSLLKKNYKGVKVKKEIEFKDLEECTKLEQIEDLMGIEPLSILFLSDETKMYRYRFFYENKDGDEICVEYLVTIDKKDKVASVLDTEFNENFNILK